MTDYAFLEILESLTLEELKKFRKFIISPYFNRSAKVIRLFDTMVKFHPNYDNVRLTKEYLHKKVSPELPYNEITMRRLLFDLQTLSEKFVQQLNFEGRPIESRTFMVEELVKRNSPKMLNKNFKASQKMVNEAGFLTSDICHSQFRFETDMFYFGIIHNSINKKTFVETESDKLIKGITYLINYFMLEGIKHSDTLLTYSRTFNIKRTEKVISGFLELIDFEKLEDFMHRNSITGNYIIDVYTKALRAFLYMNEESHYNEFKESVIKHRSKLSPSDNNFLFGKLVGYCVTKTQVPSASDDFYNNELFGIYSMIVEEKYYETETSKYFPLDLYRNIIIQATRMHELNWLEDFILNYSIHLHPRRKSDAINYANANLYFERNTYEKSLEFLSKIKMDEFSFALDAKCMYLKIYYEQGDYDTAYTFAKSYSKYLNENTMVSDYRRETNLNFVKFVIKLINYHSGRSKTDLSTLAMQISKCEKLTYNRFWLMNKTAVLERSERKAVI